MVEIVSGQEISGKIVIVEQLVVGLDSDAALVSNLVIQTGSQVVEGEIVVGVLEGQRTGDGSNVVQVYNEEEGGMEKAGKGTADVEVMSEENGEVECFNSFIVLSEGENEASLDV